MVLTGRAAAVTWLATAVLGAGGAVLVVLGGRGYAELPPEPPLIHSRAVPEPAARTVAPVLAASLPVSLTIPAIGVHTRLLRLGRTSTGALAVPAKGPDYDKAGWYTGSPTPGALGPAVIAGHVDSAADGPSVFYRLGSLHQGDLIQVVRADRTTAAFRVDAVARFHKSEFPTQLVYGDLHHAGIRLITCGGAFDSNTGHYLDDIVVTGSLVAG
ncbi:MAG: class F sortase [Mycobacteriales bacterium]